MATAVNIRAADEVIDALAAGAAACRTAACRRGCCDVIAALPADHVAADQPGLSGQKLVATGDLHDNVSHMQAVLSLTGLDDEDRPESDRCHVTFHELIHPDELHEEPNPAGVGTIPVDYSYRALVRIAAVKAAFPQLVHVLLANHELAQIAGAGITKGGVNVVKAFNTGVERVFGPKAGAVSRALGEFISALPLALRIVGGARDGRDILCCHSLPSPELIDRFDYGVLDRDLTEDDYAPRRGSAHLMVWGRAQDAACIETLADKWNVGTFVLGHEKAEMGFLQTDSRAVVLNTDHQRAHVAVLDLHKRYDAAGVCAAARPLFG